MRRIALISLGILLALGILTAVLWPSLQVEMMKAPLANAASAARRGDVSALRGCFTAGATLAYKAKTKKAAVAITDLTPLLESGAIPSIHIDALLNMTPRGKNLVEADFTAVTSLADENLPYEHVPVRLEGHVLLERQGMFTWKIQQLRSDEELWGDYAFR